MRNRTRGKVTLPMVIRMPYAGGIGGVEHHCDSSESYYAHTPGLTVVAPATVADAYTLLRKAIEFPDPVDLHGAEEALLGQGRSRSRRGRSRASGRPSYGGKARTRR